MSELALPRRVGRCEPVTVETWLCAGNAWLPGRLSSAGVHATNNCDLHSALACRLANGRYRRGLSGRFSNYGIGNGTEPFCSIRALICSIFWFVRSICCHVSGVTRSLAERLIGRSHAAPAPSGDGEAHAATKPSYN
jgi:hypothetical protein